MNPNCNEGDKDRRSGGQRRLSEMPSKTRLLLVCEKFASKPKWSTGGHLLCNSSQL